MAADEGVLGALHNKVAEVLSQQLEGQEIPGEEGEEPLRLPASAATITAAIQFLKNNNITCTPAKDNALGELEQKIKDRENKRKLKRSDLAQASQDMSFMVGLPN